jgi:hypothetical protein
LVGAIVGLAMLPLTFVPIYLYSSTRTDGYLISDHIRAAIDAPSTLGFDQVGFVGAAGVLLVALLVTRRRLGERAAPVELAAAPQQVEQSIHSSGPRAASPPWRAA